MIATTIFGALFIVAAVVAVAKLLPRDGDDDFTDWPGGFR
jgi:hypothetical protein